MVTACQDTPESLLAYTRPVERRCRSRPADGRGGTGLAAWRRARRPAKTGACSIPGRTNCRPRPRSRRGRCRRPRRDAEGRRDPRRPGADCRLRRSGRRSRCWCRRCCDRCPASFVNGAKTRSGSARETSIELQLMPDKPWLLIVPGLTAIGGLLHPVDVVADVADQGVARVEADLAGARHRAERPQVSPPSSEWRSLV